MAEAPVTIPGLSNLGSLPVEKPEASIPDYEQNSRAFQAKWADTYHPSPLPLNPNINSTVVGNPLTGPMTPANPGFDPYEYAKGAGQMLQSAGQWAKDPTNFAQPVGYGAGYRAQNFERYYSHDAFKKLGFSPFRDNEALYNSNSGFVSDFARAMPQIFKLTVTGFKDMATEWGSYGGGNNPDTAFAEEMNHAMSVGNSSKGGLGGWVTNFGVNLGYTLGIMAEMLAENAIMTGVLGLSAFTGPEGVGATGAAVGARDIAQGKKAVGMFSNLMGSYKREKTFQEVLAGMDNVEKAGALKYSAMTGKVLDFINPLEETTKFINDYDKLTVLKLSEWAKTARTAAALYKDARILNAVASESKLEGGTRKLEQSQHLMDEFYREHGRLPEGKEIENINKLSSDAAYKVTMANMPLIFLTDKLVFDQVFAGANPFKAGTELIGDEALKRPGHEIIKDIASGNLREVGKYSKAALEAAFHPSNLLTATLKYTGANLAQGLQEGVQDMIQGTLADYYNQVYKDPTNASMAASMGTGIMDQMSAEGLNTFASGFLMAGALRGLGHPVTSFITESGRKMFKPESFQGTQKEWREKGYAQWKVNKQNFINNFINTNNEIRKDPRKFESALKGMGPIVAKLKASQAVGEQALKEGNTKEFIDQQDETAFHTLIGFMRNGHFDHLQGLINDWKKMTPTELSQAWLHDPSEDEAGMDISKRLLVFEKKINKLKSMLDYSMKEMPNPVDYTQAVQENDQEKKDLYNSWEQYRYLMLYENFAFERTLDRSVSLKNKVVSDRNLGDMPSAQFAPLLSPYDLADHVRTLTAEVKSLKELGSDPKVLAFKEKQLDHLKLYSATLQNHIVNKGLHKFGKGTPEQQEQVRQLVKTTGDQLRQEYIGYMRELAKEHNVNVLDIHFQRSFRDVYDHLMLLQDRKDLSQAINVLSNPQHVKELVTRWIPGVLSKMEEQKSELYREGLETFFGREAYNALTNELQKIAIRIPPDQLEEMLNHKRKPFRYLDVAANAMVSVDSPRGREAEAILDTFLAQTGQVLSPSIVDLVKAKQEEAKAAAAVVKPVVATDLQPEITRDTPFATLPDELKLDITAAWRKRPEVPGEAKIATEQEFMLRGYADTIIDKYNKARTKPGPPLKKEIPEVKPLDPMVAENLRADIEKRREEELALVQRRRDEAAPETFAGLTPLEIEAVHKGIVLAIHDKYDQELRANGMVPPTRGEPVIKPVDPATIKKSAAVVIGNTTINPSFIGKIIYFVTGSGKTRFVKAYNKEFPGAVIDGDDVLLRHIKTFPGYEKTTAKTLSTEAHRFYKTNKDKLDKLYGGVAKELVELSNEGKTVLIGNNRLVPIADMIYLPGDKKRKEQLVTNKKKVDKEFTMAELNKIPGRIKYYVEQANVEIPVIYFTEPDIGDILTSGHPQEPQTQEVITLASLQAEYAQAANLDEAKEIYNKSLQAVREGVITTEDAMNNESLYEEAKNRLAEDVSIEALPVGTIVKTKAYKTKNGKQLLSKQMVVISNQNGEVLLRPRRKAGTTEDSVLIEQDELTDAIAGIVQAIEAPVIGDQVTDNGNEVAKENAQRSGINSIFDKAIENPNPDKETPDDDNCITNG